MTLLLDVVLRSSVILAATMVVLPFLRRRSAALRHGVLAGAMAASAVVVPLSWTVPAWTVEVPAAVAVSLSDTAALPALPETTPVEVRHRRGVLRRRRCSPPCGPWASRSASGSWPSRSSGCTALSRARSQSWMGRGIAASPTWRPRSAFDAGSPCCRPTCRTCWRRGARSGRRSCFRRARPSGADADPRGPRSRNRPHPAPGLARAARRRRAAGDLLVQPALLACVSPAAARKRTGLR